MNVRDESGGFEVGVAAVVKLAAVFAAVEPFLGPRFYFFFHLQMTKSR